MNELKSKSFCECVKKVGNRTRKEVARQALSVDFDCPKVAVFRRKSCKLKLSIMKSAYSFMQMNTPWYVQNVSEAESLNMGKQ